MNANEQRREVMIYSPVAAGPISTKRIQSLGVTKKFADSDEERMDKEDRSIEANQRKIDSMVQLHGNGVAYELQCTPLSR
mmetsp:Transcript_24134/g.29960  ORF Transcript_24134/g.29960 Transcript_24134/m.29960 type:complete len:80 (+) Transcript_24134:1066-1305(+)